MVCDRSVGCHRCGSAFCGLGMQTEGEFPAQCHDPWRTFFLFLSADEGGKIHERIDAIMRGRGLDSLLVFPGRQGGWILVYPVFAFLLFLAASYYLRGVVQRTLQRFTRESVLILGGFIVMGAGAVGLEIVVYMFMRPESMPTLYHLEVASEEFLETAGASIILYATLEIAATLCSEPPENPTPTRSRS